MDALLIAGLAIATFAGGFLRGYTGFGGALVMAPVFTRLLGPVESVALISVMHLITAFQGVRSSMKLYDRGVILPMLVAAVISVPIGVYLLGSVAPHTVKVYVAIIVVVFAIALAVGVRIVEKASVAKSVVVGSLAGILNGFCGIGGPPAIMYLLNHDHPSERLRAGFIVLFAVLYPVTVAVLWFGGAITRVSIVYALALTPINFIATEVGRVFFHRIPSRFFMPVCTIALCVVGITMLLE